MCGRYVVKNPVTKTSSLVKSAIQVEDTENYNAHPYQKLPVIKKYKNGNTLEALKWGLVPGWAKDKEFKALINARLETIDEKVSFKKLTAKLEEGSQFVRDQQFIKALNSLFFAQLGTIPHFKASIVFPFLYFFITGSF